MSAARQLFLCAATCAAWAGPVDFGKQEFASALSERKLAASRYRIQAEVSTEAPESFRIAGARISGGDLRGLMYGLLEAAEQIRSTGRLAAAKGAATIRVRGVRLTVSAADLDRRAYWEELLQALARSRLNRLNLVFEEDRALDPRALEALRLISETATAYAVDLVLSIHPESVHADGVELKAVLSGCPAIRSVQITGVGPGRLELVRAIGDAGRRVVLEIPHQDLTASILDEVADKGVPWLVSAAYTGQSPPEVAGAEALVWRLEARGAEWTDPAFVRKTLQELTKPGAVGFEIEAPRAASPETNRLLRLIWGRLSYDPKTPETVWGGKPVKKK